MSLRRSRHLPRASMPAEMTEENVHDYLEATTPNTSASRPPLQHAEVSARDDSFFTELDQKMNDKVHARISEPAYDAGASRAASDTISIQSIYDPIYELDAIIDYEDVSVAFHDESYGDSDILEVINPYFQLTTEDSDLY